MAAMVIVEESNNGQKRLQQVLLSFGHGPFYVYRDTRFKTDQKL